MSNTPLISVIVPIYNVASYLNKCINSIINQTYKNLEILLIDDGSTDESSIICDSFSKKDSRIFVVHKINEGLSSARNKGLEIARGELIGFVDGDDFLELNMYEMLLNNMIKYSSDISISNFYKIENGQKKINKKKYISKEFSVKGKEKFIYYQNEYESLTIVAWNKLYKKEVFDEVRYPIGRIHEDSYVICDLLNNANSISYIMTPLYNYVFRNNSLIHKFDKKNFDKYNSFQHKIFFFDNKGYYDLSLIEKQRMLNWLIIDLSNVKLYHIEDKSFYDYYYNYLIINSKSLKWNDSNRKIKLFKLFKKIYIQQLYIEKKIYFSLKKILKK